MIIRSKAPLRLGIAGGGTDLDVYANQYGGAVLNATINLYAHVTIETEVDSDLVIFQAYDLDETDSISELSECLCDKNLQLHKMVYHHFVTTYNDAKYIPLRVSTSIDVPAGSGLGGSSTLVVALIAAFRQLFNVPLGDYDMAALAHHIERKMCSLSGGKQDQYAATFGGFNFIEFHEDRVVVNPLRIRRYIQAELEDNLLLFYCGASRSSADIIDDQVTLVTDDAIGMADFHKVKEGCYKMKEHLFNCNIKKMSLTFYESWQAKKNTSQKISNDLIAAVESNVMASGASSFKVSGAGGGGFMMIFVVPSRRYQVIRALEEFEGKIFNFNFVNEGVFSWTI